MKPYRVRITRWFVLSALMIGFLGLICISSFPSSGKDEISFSLSRQPTWNEDHLLSRNILPSGAATLYFPTPPPVFTPSLTLQFTSTKPSVTETPDSFENIYHLVLPSESFDSIALKYGIPVEDLRNSNWMHGNAILPGQKLLVKRGKNWLPQHGGYSVLKGDTLTDILAAYPGSINLEHFTLHYIPQTYPSIDPESVGMLFENGLHNDENLFGKTLSFHFDIFVTGLFFEIPNQYLRGHSYGKDLYIVFLHDGSGDAVDQQYLAAHEMTHFYMWNTFGQPTSYLLSEGTAVYAAKSYISNSNYIPLEPFCKAFQLAGRLPRISDKELSYKGQNSDLENYFAAGCFVKYLVDTYGIEKLGAVYPNDNYEEIYGKTLLDLESEWQADLYTMNPALPFDPRELVDLNDQLKTAYSRFFADVFTSPNMTTPYIALDQARMAMLQMRFSDAHKFLQEFQDAVP